MRFRIFLSCAAMSLVGCAADESKAVDDHVVYFPGEFLWGAATAGFQVETGLDDTDWGIWAHTDGKIADGDDPNDGPDAFAHTGGDADDLVAAGLGAYRFSIELARIYPTRDDFDADTPSADGLAQYDALFDALAARRITPLVTLHHFAWPSWMSDPTLSADPQGWERSDAPTVFATFCQRMGKRYGDRVDWWITINEPVVEATVSYLSPIWPPGVLDADRTVAVMKQQVEGHARCYDALKSADGVATVSIAQHMRVYEPETDTDENLAATDHSRKFWNEWFLDAIVNGNVDEDFDDQLGAGDRTGDLTLAGRADYVGVNYYGVSQVPSRGIELPYVGLLPLQFDLDDDRPKNDLGWSIYPAGFATVLDEAAAYGLPIVVTENGIADAKDVNRARFTLEHLYQLGLAMERGVPVLGYFHWALIDNFEWASGFCPKFGMYSVDLGDPAKPRSPTAVVPLLKDLTSKGELAEETIDALPAYTSKPNPCATF